MRDGKIVQILGKLSKQEMDMVHGLDKWNPDHVLNVCKAIVQIAKLNGGSLRKPRGE